MNIMDILNESPDLGEERAIPQRSRSACRFRPAAVEYMVTYALKGKPLASRDMACLREIAIHFTPGGTVHDFLRIHVQSTNTLKKLLNEASACVRRRDYGEATAVLSQCIDLLVEWEFLRFEGPIRHLDDMLFHAAYSPAEVSKWRKAMQGFDFTEVDQQRKQNQKSTVNSGNPA